MDDKFREKVKRAIEDGTYKQELEKMNFDRFQSIEIQKGIQSHVDVLKYASPEFDAAQMKSIRLALEDGMDVEAFGIAYAEFGASFQTAFGIDDNDAVGAANAVNSSCRGVLQDRETLDVFGVDVGERAGNAVDERQRGAHAGCQR